MNNENENSVVQEEVTVADSNVNVSPVQSEVKEEKNDNRKKILTAFLMLIVTAVSLTTASYAWFTENTTVSVEDIEVTVDASNGIQISTDAQKWKANITNTDILAGYTGATNQLPSKLSPVSTIGDVETTTGFMKMFKGNLIADATIPSGYRLEATRSTEAAGTNGAAGTEGDFVAFDLFILATQATSIYLTGSSDVVTSGADKGLKNASRLAFLYQGSTTAGDYATARTLKGASSHSAGTTSNVIWEPNSTTHTNYGIAQAANYGATITDGQAVTPYYGIQTEITTANALDYISKSETYFKSVTPDILTTVGNGTDKTLPFNLAVGINKIRVYAWIEGQDYDCENNASGTKVVFRFQIAKATAVPGA